MFCFLYFQASEEKENKIKVLHIKEAGPVQFTPLDAEQRQATCELVNLKNRKPGQELKYVNVGRVCNNIHPPPKHIQRIQGNGNCLFRALCCAITGMQTGHKALCQFICDYLRQGTTYMGMDGQDYLANSQMEQDRKYGTDIELMAAAQILDRDIFVYHMYGNTHKWLRYASSVRQASNRQAVYLDNRNGTTTDGHFNLVLGFE